MAVNEEKLLKSYEDKLETIRERMQALKREYDSTNEMVSVLRRRVNGTPPAPPARYNETYGDRQTYISMIQELFSDGEPRTAGEVYEALRGRRHDGGDIKKSTIRESLNRLAGVEELEKVGRNTWRKQEEAQA